MLPSAYFVFFVQLMKQVINWGKRVADADADADADAISVAIVDDVVGCVSGNCLTVCGLNLFQFS